MAEFRVEPLDPNEFKVFGAYLGKPPSNPPTGTREDLNVWLGISDILGLRTDSAVWAFLTVNRHDLGFEKLERHNQAAEAFIPLEGSSVIAGIFFPPGVWHWAPFAISDTASFLLLLDKGVEDDIDIRDVGPHRLTLY